MHVLVPRRNPLPPASGKKYLHGEALARRRTVGRPAVVQEETERPPPGDNGCGEEGRCPCMAKVTIEEIVEEVDRIPGRAAGKAGPACG